jgi:hypothetical protein
MSESEKTQSEKIGAFWKQKSKSGVEYLSGMVNGERVVAFPVRKKLQKNSPDYQVFKSRYTSLDGGLVDKDQNNDQQKDKHEPF